MLVPAVAWLTRAMLTGEPSAARACAAAAAGRYRAHLAELVTALTGGLVLAVIGEVFELSVSKLPAGGFQGRASMVIAGLVAGVSPANAALRQSVPHAHAPGWPAALPFVGAGILVVLSWSLSTVLAGRRAEPVSDGS